MIALRGATTIKENEAEYIKKASIELIETIIEKNSLKKENIISMLFSVTQDITKDYPGKFVREELGINSAAIMHFNEMNVEKDTYLPLCIRVTVFYDDICSKGKLYHIYLHGAKNLRKDLMMD